MSGPDKEQISNIEQALERVEQEFRRAVEAKDLAGLMQAHNRMCQLVAALTAAWTGGTPTVFSRFYVPNRHTVPMNSTTRSGQYPAAQSGASSGPMPAAGSQQSSQQAAIEAAKEGAAKAAAAQEAEKAAAEKAAAERAAVEKAAAEAASTAEPPEQSLTWGRASRNFAIDTSLLKPQDGGPSEVKATGESVPKAADPAAQDDIPEIAVLEKQLAELASRMAKCLEAGDMDGMLQANEKMGVLSELMGKAEAREKERKTAAAAATASVLSKLDEAAEASPNKVVEQAAPKSLAGGWSAGDTLAFAKQRAEERKKQAKLADSFENVVGQVVDMPTTPTTPQTGSSGQQPSSTVDLLFNDRMKAKIRDSGEQIAPTTPPPPPAPKKQLTPDQLREKLESYTFYEILAIPSTASFEELHKSFIKKIRKLNKKLQNKTMDEWQFQELVAALCLAHDVLKFPNARLQYDLVLFGPEDGSGPSAEQAAKQKMMPLKDMLKFSTLIRIGDLSEAVERHKDTKDEREIGHYLVGKGLLSVEELDSIFFAQKLVSAGKLTVAQFELAMQEMRENMIPLLDTLVASEWIQPQDVFSGDFT